MRTMDNNEELERGYRGSTTLKRIGEKLNWTPEQELEMAKCLFDPIYFGENYMKIVHVDHGMMTIPLRDYQKEIITTAVNERKIIAECARQSGKTTAITVLVLWYIIFHEDKNVAILANKAETAQEILFRIKLAYEMLPKWMAHGIRKWNERSMWLENGTRVRAAATSATNIRGTTNNIVIIDEAAHIEGWDKFSTSVLPTISSGDTTKIILISTVNGLNHFWRITEAARAGKSDYKLISVDWTRVPGRDEDWKRQALADLNFDMDRFEQEYSNRYLGSSGTLIAGWKLEIMKNDFQDPIMEHVGITLFERADPNRQYIGVADVSRGRMLDYSVLQVIDITEMPYRQVAMVRSNKLTPIEFSEIINTVGRQYNMCPILVEINDIGGQVADMLYYDHEYEMVLNTESAGRMGKRVCSTYTNGKTDRGIRTTRNVKTEGCYLLKILIEQNGLVIRDKETHFELSTFSKASETAQYEAEEGMHDDTVMPLVLFAWLTSDNYFKDLTSINPIAELRERDSMLAEADMVPFGFYADGVSEDPPVVIHNDLWFHVQDPYFDK